ncbi:hypothetical protein BCR22_02565 [Enterococcus plantarum]|nr:hypothetical protein [Enterococcus plantarum]OEG17558.1 hypothetical protein BCR22_02565 [Enterococcus plantarum]
METSSKSKSPEEMNKEYFKSFVVTRGSISSLYISWAGLVITFLCLPITWNVAILGYGINPLQSKVNIFIVFIAIFMLLTFLTVRLSFTRKFLFRHQGFASIWLIFFSVLLTSVLMFMFYMITQWDKPNEIWYESEFSIIVLLLFGLTYLGSLFYNFYWLKKQLKIGFSEKRTTANYFARAKVYESKSLWIIFGFSMIGAFLTGNLARVFGLVFGMFLGAAFSRLTIELAYSAFLLNTDKEYWVNYIDEPEKPWKEVLKKRLKKTSTYVIMGVLLIVAMVEIEDRYKVPKGLQITFSYVLMAILLFFVVAFIMWIIKKVRDKRDTKQVHNRVNGMEKIISRDTEKETKKMNEKKVQRKWALVIAVLFTLGAINQLVKGMDLSESYGAGSLVSLIAFPAIFYYLAFKKKKEK